MRIGPSRSAVVAVSVGGSPGARRPRVTEGQMARRDAARRRPNGRDREPAHKGPEPARAVAALVALQAALLLAGPASAAPGDLDPAFGTAGVSSLPGTNR